MSLCVLRAIGTESILKSHLRMASTCLLSKSSKYCCSQTKRMSSSKPITPSSEEASPEKKTFGPVDGYTTVYRLPSAGKFAFINSSKRNQTKVIAIAAPLSFALAYLDIISGETTAVICIAGILLALKLHLLSIFATNMIGFVYISHDRSTVQISYIDHSGTRQDEIHPVSDIVPLSESPSNIMETFYSKVLTYSNEAPVPYYKLNLSFGEILDRKQFRHIFGNPV